MPHIVPQPGQLFLLASGFVSPSTPSLAACIPNGAVFLEDQGLGGTAQCGPSVRVASTACSIRSSSGAGHGGAAEAGDPELVPLEVTLAEVAVATGDAVDGEVFTDLDVGGLLRRLAMARPSSRSSTQ